jgi:hypothetical protein
MIIKFLVTGGTLLKKPNLFRLSIRFIFGAKILYLIGISAHFEKKMPSCEKKVHISCIDKNFSLIFTASNRLKVTCIGDNFRKICCLKQKYVMRDSI